MTTYISILRGINVSGHKIIKMEALRNMYENLGFHDVTTYLQSGNVIFRTKEIDNQQLEQTIIRQIKDTFGFDVPVIIMTIDTLKQIIATNPFLKDKNKDQAFMHITFLSSTPEVFYSNSIEDKKQEGEEIFFTSNAAYLYCPGGYGNTNLNNNFLEKELKVLASTRNWKTTNELLKIANQIT